jgi:hypothetical protein
MSAAQYGHDGGINLASFGGQCSHRRVTAAGFLHGKKDAGPFPLSHGSWWARRSCEGRRLFIVTSPESVCACIGRTATGVLGAGCHAVQK